MARTNWAGNITFDSGRFHEPGSVARVQEIVADSRRVRVLGTGHSFNALARTDGDLLSVARLPPVVEVDETAGTVAVSGGLRYGEIVDAVDRAGFALANLASLPHLSVAGACATGTHGSGVGNRCLAAAVRSIELVTASGELVSAGRSDPGFAGSVVALGTLGVVTRLTLDLVPRFEVRQRVYEGLPAAALRERFDEVMGGAYSVSLFTDWRSDVVNQVWVKSAGAGGGNSGTDTGTGTGTGTGTDIDTDAAAGAALRLGARAADGPRHPVPGMPPESCTDQSGAAGPWHDRLPHFRLAFTPSSGDELQSEFFVARRDAVAAFDALTAIRERIAPVLWISEIRTVAADDLWLSPAYGTDSVAFHFTWLPDPVAVAAAVRAVEDALAPFGARPHWGKVFGMDPETVAGRYPRFGDFEELRARTDPSGKFRNAFTAWYFR